MSYREDFARAYRESFAAFLKEYFPTRAHAAVWSGKSIRQIDNYIEELCRAPGELVVKALRDPETRSIAGKHLLGWNNDEQPEGHREPPQVRPAHPSARRNARA